MINARLSLEPLAPASDSAAPAEWEIAPATVGYLDAVARMEARATAIAAGDAPELVWLLEHPPLFTTGTSARAEDLAGASRFPVHASGRGGRLTYHGPGQRVGYAMLDLRSRGADVRRYVLALEEWIIRALARFDVKGERRADRIGVWVARPDKGEAREDKIAALGIRVKRWVTLHGISLNVAPDLSHYAGVRPCGVREQKWGVTSLADLGINASISDVDAALQTSFVEIFGPIRRRDVPYGPQPRAQAERLTQALIGDGVLRS
jgi:lipoyl(octanoyl) transferase